MSVLEQYLTDPVEAEPETILPLQFLHTLQLLLICPRPCYSLQLEHRAHTKVCERATKIAAEQKNSHD